MTFSLSFEPRVSDLIRSSATSILGSRWLKYLFGLFFIIAPFVVATLLIIRVVETKDYTLLPAAARNLLIPVVAVLFFLLAPALINWRKFKSNPAFKGVHTYKFDDQTINMVGPGFDNVINWDIISKCEYSKYGLILYSGNPVMFIPSRAFDSQQDKSRIVDEILSKIEAAS